MKNQECVACGDKLIGRLDKKYCSDHCRSVYNNRLNSDQTKFVRNINNMLRRNRRILKQLNPKGKSTVHRDDLLKSGFNFSYFTNVYVTKAGKTYCFCYDQGYLSLENDYFALVHKQTYVS